MWAVRVSRLSQDLGPAGEDSAKECWDQIFAQLDAAKQAEVDPVGRLRASRAADAKSGRPQTAEASETPRKTSKPPGLARPQTSRNRRQRPQEANRYRPKSEKVLETGFRLAVGQSGLFDPSSGVLHPKNFGTWDKNRCHLPERLWPCQGAIGTLYDVQRRDKVDWRRGMPRGRDFGMAWGRRLLQRALRFTCACHIHKALADVGTGTAAEAFVAKYVRKQRATVKAAGPDQEADIAAVAHDDSLYQGRRTTVRWLGGCPVHLEFGA
ncbi:unnamed protein product [Symbiodinium necroappetens]|uniref:Uncharacterized protein n=1 Tax=Symbiodinium necroappetens TaxID=1628268 RepID=A0A812QHT8_9DINO|nr:unnamed protein product [Symbiodinium necroappetens]